MSFRKALWALIVVVCLATPAAVRAQGDYLDVFIAKVKPEKVADFQALTKKWVDANRRFNGVGSLLRPSMAKAMSTSSPAPARTTPMSTKSTKPSCSPPTKPSARTPR
jgi:hypothetical protein